MSTYIKVGWIIAFNIILVSCMVASTSSYNEYEPAESHQQLTFCDDDQIHQSDKNAGLLYVSTLDGKISALDILKDGEKKWSISTAPGQMISSSIQNLELTNDGQLVRMIPSLGGSLYKFDGETVEPIPINADNLLSTSFKFSDDLLISGGKETISYGVSAASGQIMYECSMHGCVNSTEIDSNSNDDEENEFGASKTVNAAAIAEEVIIVRRQTQIVRAIEPRTGEERWNFSVGQHEVESISKTDDCHASSSSETKSKIHNILAELELKVVVPEGLICAVYKKAPHVVVWKQKFDHPIVNVWKRDENNKLKMVDLFRTAHGMWQSPKQTSSTDSVEELTPSIYIGMFEKQLYIQECDQLRIEQAKLIDTLIDDVAEQKRFARIPWQPVEASSSALAIEGPEQSDTEDTIIVDLKGSDTAMVDTKHDLTAATSILYGSEYVNGNGFYLYAKSTKSTVCKKNTSINAGDTKFDDRDFYTSNRDRIADMVNVVSIWYWWREILLISLTVLVFNVVLTQRRPSEPEVVVVERHVEIKVPATPEPQEQPLVPIEYHPYMHINRSISESNASENDIDPVYKSRFQLDFDMLQCLGKGGFGVVFEVRNKIDDCKYAIKRIVLPKSKQSRERVMREVKTLANCEHANIVRYFQAWVENPPPKWQENEDQIWMDRYAMSHSIDIDSPSAEETSRPFPDFPSLPPSDRVHSEAFNHNKLDFLISGLQTNECVNFDDVIRKTNFSNSNNYEDDDDDDDCSFIQFKADDIEESLQQDSCETLPKSKASELPKPNDSSSTSSSSSSEEEGDGDEEDNNDELSNSVFRFDPCAPSIDKNPFSNKHLTKFFGKKKRSYSMNEACSTTNFSASNGNINMTNVENHREPFKKTHRRPLSLDLTSTGSVHIPILPDTESISLPSSNIPTSYLYIQMQLCRKQSLKDWLFETDASIRHVECLSIFKQIVEAVEYVHLKGLIHRDLKPSNIFFSLDGQIKIGDFGLVTDMSDSPKVITPCGDASGLPSCAKHTEQVGTHLYMSPEQLRGRQYSYKVDIYSLGLIFFELLVVFGTEMERIETIKSLRSSRFPEDFPDKFPDEFNLLKLMLSRNPDKRPTTFGIRAKPPFSDQIDPVHHFELPPRRRDSQSFSSGLSSHSNNSSSINLRQK